MAVVSNNLTNSMVLKIKTGVDAQGQDVFSSKKFSIKAAATDQNIYDTAAAFDAILENPLNEIQKAVTSGLVNA